MPPELPQRRSIRLKGYDYASEGAYYLTICTEDRLHLFGTIIDAQMHPSPLGELAQRCWDAIPEHMPHVDIGEFIVMPNHVHGIVIIRERSVVRADHDRPDTNVRPDTNDRPATNPDPDAQPPLKRPMPTVPVGSLGRIVRAYKSAVTRIAYRDGVLPRGTPVWQRNYWEHIIRDDAEWARIADYIRDNPAKWHRDRFSGTGRS